MLFLKAMPVLLLPELAVCFITLCGVRARPFYTVTSRLVFETSDQWSENNAGFCVGILVNYMQGA